MSEDVHDLRSHIDAAHAAADRLVREAEERARAAAGDIPDRGWEVPDEHRAPERPSELAQIGGWSPKIRSEHTVLIGLRNLDEREKVAVRDSGVHVFTMKDIDRQGIASIVEQAVALAGNGTAGIHVSFDMDACDPSIAPGVGTSVPGGATFREAHLIMEMLHDSGLVRSIDLVELNPFLDERGRTAGVMVDLTASLLGRRIFDRPTRSLA